MDSNTVTPGREALMLEFREAFEQLTRVSLHVQSQVLRPLGLTIIQGLVLGALWRSDDPLDMVSLAERTVLPPSTITNVVDRLEALGWASRQPHPADRRRVMVAITASGREMLEKYTEISMRMTSSVLNEVDDARIRTTIEVVNEMATNLGELNVEHYLEAGQEP